MRLRNVGAVLEVQVKSKKLIILISVAVVIVAMIVILASVFAVRAVSPIYHNFDGSQTVPEDGAPTADDVLKFSKGKSIFFMSKDKLLADLNENFDEWHAFAVVKNFPNNINVHFVKREAVVKVDVGGNVVYVDSFGYVVSQPSEDNCVDISSVLEYRDASVNEKGKKLQFAAPESNARFDIVLEAIITCWRCSVDLQDIPVVFGGENVFSFDQDGNFIVHTSANAQIKIVAPSTDLTNRLLKAYSVYYNEKLDLQQAGVVITVEKNGNIITPNTGK